MPGRGRALSGARGHFLVERLKKVTGEYLRDAKRISKYE
jgi:hypothetical protein